VTKELELGPEALQGAVDSLPLELAIVDGRRRIRFVNRALADRLKASPEALIGRPCPDLLRAEGCPLEEVATSGRPLITELPRGKGWVRVAIYPLGSLDGEALFLYAATDATQEVDARRRLALRVGLERALRRVVQASLQDLPFEKLLERILREALRLPKVKLESKGAIFLVEGGELRLACQVGLPKELRRRCARVPVGHCLCGRAALGRPAFSFQLDERHETSYPGIAPHGHACLPLTVEGEVIGVLNLYLPAGARLSKEELDFLEVLAGVVAKTVAHARAEHRLVRTFSQTVRMLSRVVEQRDPYTAGHQERVAKLACAIAEEMGLPEERVEGLHLAALVHDVGKIAIPAEILSYPGELDPLQRRLIQQHPQHGWELLKDLDFPWPIADWVAQHHERLDGSGYPKGLKGEEIALEARILAVADVVEAMTSHRPYRPALGVQAALEELEKGKGRLYDPEVVAACRAVLTRARTEGKVTHHDPLGRG